MPSAATKFPATRSGLRLGLGGAPLGNLFAAVPQPQADALLRAALLDAQSLDTAPHYGQGLSEHRMGQVLRTLPRDSFALSTKVGRLLTPDANAAPEQNSYADCLPFTQRWDFSAQGVRRSVEDSLQRLGLARLDAVYIHDCDAHTHGARYPKVLRSVVEQCLPELHAMRREGLLRHIGLGVNDVQVCLDVLRAAPAAQSIDCLMLAGRYSLIDHSALPELLPLCVQRGVRIALGGVFNSGILATGVRSPGAQGSARFNYVPAAEHWLERVDAIEGICAEFSVPLRAAALQFPLAHPAVDIVMVGARHVDEWNDAMAMMRHTIPADFWQALRSRNLLPTDALTPVHTPTEPT
jgi:D-threo-aldose 1-dehydrogenase